MLSIEFFYVYVWANLAKLFLVFRLIRLDFFHQLENEHFILDRFAKLSAKLAFHISLGLRIFAVDFFGGIKQNSKIFR
jgi:hypothetical protein